MVMLWTTLPSNILCGMQNFDCLVAHRHRLHVHVHLLHVGQRYLKERGKQHMMKC